MINDKLSEHGFLGLPMKAYTQLMLAQDFTLFMLQYVHVYQIVITSYGTET